MNTDPSMLDVSFFASDDDQIPAFQLDLPAVNERLAFIIDTIANSPIDDIDICKVHCHKTGREITKIPVEQYEQLTAMHGIERAREIIIICAMQYTDPLWLHTDGKRLDYLMAIDPIGYCVYSTVRVYRKAYLTLSGNEYSRTIDTAYRRSEYEFTVKIRQRLEYLQPTKDDLNELNELMRQYLSIAHTGKITSIARDMSIDVASFTIDELKTNLHHAIKAVLSWARKHNYIDRTGHVTDLTKLKTKVVGYSNYRQQAKLKHLTESEQMGHALDQLIGVFLPQETLDHSTVSFVNYHGPSYKELRAIKARAAAEKLKHKSDNMITLNIVMPQVNKDD